MPSIREIEGKVTSSDVEVLRQCLAFVDDRMRGETDRAKSAESRGTAMLALIAAASAVLVNFAGPLGKQAGGIWLPVVVFVSSALFLLKSSYYAIRVLGVGQRYRLTEGIVFEIQALSVEKALQRELVAKIWEYKQAIPHNSDLLYWLQRCQRSLLVAILYVLGIGGLFLLQNNGVSTFPPSILVFVSITSVVILLSGDPISEKLGIWNGGEHKGN